MLYKQYMELHQSHVQVKLNSSVDQSAVTAYSKP